VVSSNQIKLIGVGCYLIGWMTALAWHFGAPIIVYVPASTLALTALGVWALRKQQVRR
jgi:hypothetical protein